jgi:hypothetical protein
VNFFRFSGIIWSDFNSSIETAFVESFNGSLQRRFLKNSDIIPPLKIKEPGKITNQDISGETRRSSDLNVDDDTAVMQNQIVTFTHKQKKLFVSRCITQMG